MTVWNATVDNPPGARRVCKVPSPADFAYPSSYRVQPMEASPLFGPSADRWTEGQDDLSAVDSSKYEGGVLLPDGRVVLVPYSAKHVGLYDPSTDRWTEGQDDLSAAGSSRYYGGVLLPDGRVVLVPDHAKHVGLYDAGGTHKGAAYTVASMTPAWNALLLPYYNKL